jgi:hypothetical protein
MKTLHITALLLTLAMDLRSEIRMDWAYHDNDDLVDNRTVEMVPGESFAFLAHGSAEIANGDAVRVYILTANQFAGEAEEKVSIRWWNGQEERWLEAAWQKNIHLGGEALAVGLFHGQPAAAAEMVDLWLVEVPADVTVPGDNYYVIQLSGSDGEARYLLRETAGEFGSKNNLGQAWTAAPEGYFGHDWKVSILE